VYGKEEQRNTPMSDGRRLRLRLSDDNMVDDTFAQLVNLIGLDVGANQLRCSFLSQLVQILRDRKDQGSGDKH